MLRTGKRAGLPVSIVRELTSNGDLELAAANRSRRCASSTAPPSI
jgi:hypothetical protein